MQDVVSGNIVHQEVVSGNIVQQLGHKLCENKTKRASLIHHVSPRTAATMDSASIESSLQGEERKAAGATEREKQKQNVCEELETTTLGRLLVDMHSAKFHASARDATKKSCRRNNSIKTLKTQISTTSRKTKRPSRETT